jgi:hypothetical protein
MHHRHGRGLVRLRHDSIRLAPLCRRSAPRAQVVSSYGNPREHSPNPGQSRFGGLPTLDGAPSLSKAAQSWVVDAREVRLDRRGADAVAPDDCRGFFLPRATFRAFLDTHSTARWTCLDIVVDQLRRLTAVAGEIALLDVPSRLAPCLLRLAGQGVVDSEHGVRRDRPVRLQHHLPTRRAPPGRVSISSYRRSWTKASSHWSTAMCASWTAPAWKHGGRDSRSCKRSQEEGSGS